MKKVIFIIPIFFWGCIHTYDMIPTKTSICLKFDAKKQTIEYSCKEKASKDQITPKLIIDGTKGNLDSQSGKYNYNSEKSFTHIYNNEKLPYLILDKDLDSFSNFTLFVRYNNKKFELNIRNGLNRDSIYYFLEY